MSNVFEFPLRNCIAIDYGVVTRSSDPEAVGRHEFFVTWIDEDGCECGLYDSADYTLAFHEAKEAQRDFGATRIIERFRRQDGVPA